MNTNARASFRYFARASIWEAVESQRAKSVPACRDITWGDAHLRSQTTRPDVLTCRCARGECRRAWPGMLGGRHCDFRSSSGWRPADAGDAQEALDAAVEAEIVRDCEVAGGGSGTGSTPHRFDHVVGQPFAKASRCRGSRFSLWPVVPRGRQNASLQVSSLCGVRVNGKYLHRSSEAISSDLQTRSQAFVQQQSTAARHPPRLSPNRFNADRVGLAKDAPGPAGSPSTLTTATPTASARQRLRASPLPRTPGRSRRRGYRGKPLELRRSRE
jgi:hypothetical protein